MPRVIDIGWCDYHALVMVTELQRTQIGDIVGLNFDIKGPLVVTYIAGSRKHSTQALYWD